MRLRKLLEALMDVLLELQVVREDLRELKHLMQEYKKELKG